METIFYNNDDINSYEYKEEDVFKSSRSAPACDDIKALENDLFHIIKNIKFSSYKSNFQKKLKQILNNLLTKNKVILFADKTRNIYHTSPKFYNKLVTDNLTKTYKTSNDDLVSEINLESEKIIYDRKYKNKKCPNFQPQAHLFL